MKRSRYLWIPAATIWLVLLELGAGSIPALGPVFEVRNGIWQHDRLKLESQNLEGLEKQVVVTFDRSGVPHIFAESAADLFRAQGFVTASQRLFQLDINTRQTAGRLTEIYGSKALPYDQFFTRFGMREAARKTWAQYAEDPQTKTMVESYVAGINAWIDRLPQLPPEYKILGARPEKFDPVRVIHMGKALTWSLSGRSFDPYMTGYLQKWGAEKVLDLFPEYVDDKYEDFVFPEHLKNPHAPEKPGDFKFISALKEVPRFPLPNPGRGSNNWAVAPRKSTLGRSLLANDTHLSLTLPSTWYENQLSCPDFNVYGVSLAAIPGIVNGFNKNVSWGPTNGTTDVLDFFEVEFENETSLRYKWNGAWEEAQVRTEKIAHKKFGSEDVEVIQTKLGPLLHREGKLGLVADWTGYRAGHELAALRKQWTAKTASECMKGFAEWLSPIQNFMCADAHNIGWIHAGFVPKRQSGEGRFFRDGRGSEKPLLTAVEKVPQSLNPEQGYLLSANQKIVPRDYPDYLGWDYEPPFRGMTIRHFLTSQGKLSPEDLMAMQNENLDMQAQLILPLLLRQAKSSPWVERLRGWDYRIRATTPEAAVFKAWWAAVKDGLFGDELGGGAVENAKLLLPKDARVAWMLERLEKNPEDSDKQWVDDINTKDHIETLAEIIDAALAKALFRLTTEQGPESGWSWKLFNQTRFSHAGRLPGFGSQILAMDGSTETIRGQGGMHGAVYKAVVAMTDWPTGWMQVPGGNEGDPFSPEFDRFVQDWVEGKMRPVEFYHNVDEAIAKAERVVYLKPGGAP